MYRKVTYRMLDRMIIEANMAKVSGAKANIAVRANDPHLIKST